MNQKAIVVMEIVKNDRIYQFSMPMGAPLGECYDAAFEVLNKIVEISKQAVDNSAKEDIQQEAEKTIA